MIKRLLKAHRLHFSAVSAAIPYQIYFGDVQQPLAICHWVKFISNFSTLIKSNQFICYTYYILPNNNKKTKTILVFQT